MEERRNGTNMRILAYCLMPNHRHMVLWPRKAKTMAGFVGWVSNTHVRRWREHRHKVGERHAPITADGLFRPAGGSASMW